VNWRPILLLVAAIILALSAIVAISWLEDNLLSRDDSSFTEVALADLNITPTLPITVTPTPQGLIHRIQAGESLFEIAQRYGIVVEALAQVNQIEDVALIYEGQELVIPLDSEGIIQLTNSALNTPTLTFTNTIVSRPTETPLTATETSSAPPSTATITPTATQTSTPTITSTGIADLGIITPTPTPTFPIPATINSVSIDTVIAMSPAVIENINEIYADGQSLGRNPQAFSKLGDSTIENPHFLARFDGTFYNLGEWDYLQGVIDWFQGSHGRQGVAVQRGLHTWSVLDPAWASNATCFPAEHMVDCEIRVHNPSMMIVRLGSNDRGVPDATERNLRAIVEAIIAQGVIPILGTKADRQEGSNINNQIIRQIAQEYDLPLFDFDLLASTLPQRGLTTDSVHMTSFYAHDYTQNLAFRTGHGVHNLLALIVLDRVWRTVTE